MQALAVTRKLLQILNWAISLGLNQAFTHIRKAEVLMAVGRKSEAMEAYKNVLRLTLTNDLAVLAQQNFKKLCELIRSIQWGSLKGNVVKC